VQTDACAPPNTVPLSEDEVDAAVLSMDLQQQFEHVFATRNPRFHEVPEDGLYQLLRRRILRKAKPL
jgi:hypothetical protein